MCFSFGFRATIVMLLLIVGSVSANAQEQGNKSIDTVVTKTPEEMTARKEALTAFVEEHHPELKRLLKLLEERKPTQFRNAIRTLSRQYDRLQAVRRRDPDKYEIALQFWKVQSRIEVQSAKIALHGPEKYEEKLKALLAQKQEVRVRLQKYEVARTQERLKRQREVLKRLRDSSDTDVEKQLQQILNRKNRR